MQKQVVVVAILFALSFGAIGAELSCLSVWSSPPLSPEDVAALTTQLQQLEQVVADPTLGSQRAASEVAWTSAAFSMYSAGVLAEKGYEVRIATGEGWPDGPHAWVLVRLTGPTTSLWVPVEAAPSGGTNQMSLGRIPTIAHPGAAVAFEERYTVFSAVAELPTNRPPVANLRLPSLHFTLSDTPSLLGINSYDPDGQIVLYRWKIGDADWFATRMPSVKATLHATATFVVSLQVVDNHGASDVATVTVSVVDPSDLHLLDEPDCGCGG